MKTATLIQGTVKYKAGEPRQTSTGRMRINIVVTPSSGSEDIKVWGNPGDAIAYLQKGQPVTLAHDGKGYTLISTDLATSNGNGHHSEDPAPEPPTTEPGSDLEEMRDIVQFFLAAFPVLPHSEIISLAQSIFKYRRG
ncbi:MAG: hypothetical protein NW224_11970 [Leptolyngbyaceae cyanobacterium bins.302]|nr:hypothetical protein [Leptolyngbyaceae cyanobacterium bins.302]